MEPLPIAEPTREEIDNHKGAILLEFGAQWCGYCQAAQAVIASEMSRYHNIRHMKIEDGKGRRLGRTFHVKLWPTLIFMKDGVELGRLVRDINAEELKISLQQLVAND